jgi:hypothetical protein
MRMSVKIMGAIWEKALDHPDALVLLALADHADHDGGNAYPSVGLLAWKTGYSVRQVRRILRSLEASGAIVPTTRAGQHKPTTYLIDLSAIPDKPARADILTVQKKVSGRTSATAQGGHLRPESPPRPDTTVSAEPSLTENHPLEPSILQPAAAEKPKSWTARACDSWTAVMGGTAPGGRIGKALKPFVTAHGADRVIMAWERYLSDTPAQFATAEGFAAKFGIYAKDKPQGRENGRHGSNGAVGKDAAKTDRAGAGSGNRSKHGIDCEAKMRANTERSLALPFLPEEARALD